MRLIALSTMVCSDLANSNASFCNSKAKSGAPWRAGTGCHPRTPRAGVWVGPPPARGNHAWPWPQSAASGGRQRAPGAWCRCPARPGPARSRSGPLGSPFGYPAYGPTPRTRGRPQRGYTLFSWSGLTLYTHIADHLWPDLKLFAIGVCRVQGRPLRRRPGRASGLFSAAESGMVRRAAFDLPGEPGPSVRRPPEPSTWAHRTTLKQPAQHARGLPGACFPRLQTMGARPYLSAGHRV